MRKFTKEQSAEAKRLAIAYSAYFEANDTANDRGLAYWGEVLIEAQEATGATLLNPENVRARISIARQRTIMPTTTVPPITPIPTLSPTGFLRLVK